MSDIIKDAKQLLAGTTPAPWVTGGKDESGNIYVGNPSEEGNLVATVGSADADLIAAAPELAQALAEETWEYAVAFKSTNGMGYLDRSGQPQPWPLLAAWYLTKENAQVALMSSVYRKESLCIVRRRVSPIYMAELI